MSESQIRISATISEQHFISWTPFINLKDEGEQTKAIEFLYSRLSSVDGENITPNALNALLSDIATEYDSLNGRT
jgi:hypothetical protein